MTSKEFFAALAGNLAKNRVLPRDPINSCQFASLASSWVAGRDEGPTFGRLGLSVVSPNDRWLGFRASFSLFGKVLWLVFRKVRTTGNELGFFLTLLTDGPLCPSADIRLWPDAIPGVSALRHRHEPMVL